MANVGKSTSKINKRDTRPRSSSVCEEEPAVVHSLAIAAHDLERLRVPKPPSDSQKPKAMTRVFIRKTRPPDEVTKTVQVTVARPLPQVVAPPPPFEYAGPGGLRFDKQGMLLPHSILGSLEDFKTEMELRGETELLQRIPDAQVWPPLVVETENHDCKAEGLSETGRSHQSHALQHWFRHMTERRRQQDCISRLLQKPVDSLLMSSGSFRRVQEQRALIHRGLALHSGHGGRAGSEFWSVPEHYGDELSGITATLTQTERGNPPEITRIAHTLHTRLETGVCDAVSSGWGQSSYLQQRRQELRDVLSNFTPPDMDDLEVLGSAVCVSASPLLEEREEEEEEEQKESRDPLALFDDIITDVDLIPALRVSGKLAHWTGSTSSHQGQEGVSVRLMFETVTGRSVNAVLELKNEGSTVIYYSWERLTPTHTHTQHFYFNNTTAVILPSSTEHISFTFKSASVGIMTEVWSLNTHPVLMGGALLQVTLRGVALDQDESAQQRAALQKELEHKACVSMCSRIVSDLLAGVHSPERPSSPDHLYTTDEELFHTNNPGLQYQRGPVEALRRLWEQVTGSPHTTHVWDLSLHTFAQVLLSVPETDESRESSLSQFNTLILELQSHHRHTHAPVTSSHLISLQLWRELIDGLVCESVRLRHTLGLQENNVWSDTTHNNSTLERQEEERRAGTPPLKEQRRRASVRGLEDSRGARARAEERESVKKQVPEEKTMNTEEKNSSFTTDTHTLQDRYRTLLHKQVYLLMERMVDSLCDLLDDSHIPQTSH